MNKKLWQGTVGVFVVLAILDYFIHNVLLSSTYQEESMRHLWREDMKTGVFLIVDVFVAFFFTLIFSKGYEGKGIMEGVRYGFYIGMLMSVPMAYSSYGAMPITYSLALQWFIYRLIGYIILGIVVAWIYGIKPKEPVTP